MKSVRACEVYVRVKSVCVCLVPLTRYTPESSEAAVKQERSLVCIIVLVGLEWFYIYDSVSDIITATKETQTKLNGLL